MPRQAGTASPLPAAIAAFFLVLLAAPSAGAMETLCQTGGVRLSVDFPTGGRHACTVDDEDSFTLSVTPESTPINSSPWYAFRLEADHPTKVDVTLDYGDYRHRYAPKLSTDGVKWKSLPAKDVLLDEDREEARLKIKVPKGAVFVAAQPIETPEAMHAWIRTKLAPLRFGQVEYGRSIEGRPLIGYVGGEGSELVVAITRQHPPETTGSTAFRAFVDKITSNDPAAVAFRKTHRILLVPAPNPDGVLNGNWRQNMGRTDLNRDWIKQRQPETKALIAFIQAEAAGRATVAFFDFHSTSKDVIYAPPLDSDSPTIGLLPFMKTHFDKTLKRRPAWSYNHTGTSGNSKSWALETLKAPGVTVELDDNTVVADSRAIGKAVAEALIAYEAAN